MMSADKAILSSLVAIVASRLESEAASIVWHLHVGSLPCGLVLYWSAFWPVAPRRDVDLVAGALDIPSLDGISGAALDAISQRLAAEILASYFSLGDSPLLVSAFEEESPSVSQNPACICGSRTGDNDDCALHGANTAWRDLHW